MENENRAGENQLRDKKLEEGRQIKNSSKPSNKRQSYKLPKLPGDPTVVPRSEHTVSRKNIDDDCLKVIRRLNRNGHQAFLVGGGVRDLLLNKTPKDFDLSTDASPEQVRSLFRNSRIIGRRFRLNHVYFKGNKIIEVSTFRRSSEADESPDGEMLENDNLYGDPETDAFRRDLTINGLFYELENFSVIDYVGGLKDLEAGVVRMIGEPEVRFEEDPVRMIRAIRHAARADFKIEPNTHRAICEKSNLIAMVPPSRVYEEFIKDMRGGSFWVVMQLLFETDLLKYLLPNLSESIDSTPVPVWQRLDRCLQALDAKVKAGKEFSPGLVFAMMFFGNVPKRLSEDFSGMEDGEDLSALFKDVPELFGEDTEQIRAQKVSSLLKHLREVGRPQRSRRGNSSAKYTKIFAEVLDGLIVPKREREIIECLIVARYIMVLDPKAQSSGLESKSYFDEALFLLGCTAQGETEHQALLAWSAKERRTPKKGQREDRKRPQRRRRKRR